MMQTVSLVVRGDLRGLTADIQKYPVNLNDRDHQGHSLTSVAVRENQPHILKWLLFNGGPPLQTKGLLCGRTAWYVFGDEFGISAKKRNPTSNWKRRNTVSIFMLRIMLMQDQPSASDWSYIQEEFPDHVDLLHAGYTLRNQFLDRMLDTTLLQATRDFLSHGVSLTKLQEKRHSPLEEDGHRSTSSAKQRIWKKLKKKQIRFTLLRVST
jgi:hypothetical protein